MMNLEMIRSRWAFEEPYCEDCFDNMFNYCCSCDGVIYRESAHYNDEGDPYCNDCYEDNYDDDAPDNPDVSDSDRELVVKLSRSWLQGKIETRRPLFINDKDILLRTIKDKVGLVDNPIYVFGLTDRDEYQLSATSDLFDTVQSFSTGNAKHCKGSIITRMQQTWYIIITSKE